MNGIQNNTGPSGMVNILIFGTIENFKGHLSESAEPSFAILNRALKMKDDLNRAMNYAKRLKRANNRLSLELTIQTAFEPCLKIERRCKPLYVMLNRTC